LRGRDALAYETVAVTVQQEDSDTPYAGVRIRTLGELNWNCADRSIEWRSGNVRQSARQHTKR
jgi:hypothetical protein